MNLDFFDNIYAKYRENKLSHVYLIETNDIEYTFSKLKKLCKKIQCDSHYSDDCSLCNICNLINEDNHPNIITIEPDGQYIKKEQIIDLKNRLLVKPIISKFNIYIIKNAEFLNESSSNSLLKFLEEPSDSILGFLIVGNQEKLLDTITSRCQKFSDFNEKVDILDFPEITKLSQTYFDILNTNPIILINANKESISVIDSKDKLAFFLKNLLHLYLSNNDFYSISKITLINALLNDIRYNVNVELILDKLVLEMSDINE